MQVYQHSFTSIDEFDSKAIVFKPDLILIFFSKLFDKIDSVLTGLNDSFPTSIISGCSTSGEISGTQVSDQTISLNAIKFDKTKVSVSYIDLASVENSNEAGRALGTSIKVDDLKHVLIFSDGLNIDGAELSNGLNDTIDSGVGITGGLAGDGSDFEETFIIKQDKLVKNCVAAIGLAGNHLECGYSSQGGWDSFGIEREVTKSEGNVLFELDGKPALDLYKSYLGPKANELPGSALIFPLSLRTNENQDPVVRTILGVTEESNSMTFAGSIPEGSYVRLMKANVNRLIDGSESAASIAKESITAEPEFILLVSCVGRRIVLKQLVEEELEAVRDVFGAKPKMAGFYSYGELGPFGMHDSCQLHNQTMTVSTFCEV